MRWHIIRTLVHKEFLRHIANRVARDHEFHPAILLPSFGRVIRSLRLRFAKAARREPAVFCSAEWGS